VRQRRYGSTQSVFPLDNGEWSGSRPDRFPHGKESPVGTGWVAEWVSNSMGIHPVVVATILNEMEQSQENIVRNRITDVQSTILPFNDSGILTEGLTVGTGTFASYLGDNGS